MSIIGGPTPTRKFWWSQTSDYWEVPFPTEAGLSDFFAIVPDPVDQLAAREQLWAVRELPEDVFEPQEANAVKES